VIVQEHGDGLLVFRQTDHALLSGAFAAAWGNDRVPAPARRHATVVAAARHDDGWAEWELAPRVNESGEPVDFIHIPVAEHVRLYKRGIDLVESEDPYAGLLASLHGQRLYTRPFYPGMDPRIEHLQGPDLEMATAYVEGERDRQDKLVHVIEGEGLSDDAEEGWRLLQVWDRLSLLVCMSPLREGTDQKLPTITVNGDGVAILARANDRGELLCDPYPFRHEPATFTIEAFRTPRRTWESEAAYRHELRTSAERVLVTFTCRAG
jgi:hypothetical protein